MSHDGSGRPVRRYAVRRGAVGSAYIPKLLGIYERELHPIVERACTLGFRQIVDIGAAEGYYAVGMALRNPSTRVVAFEADEHGRTLLRRMAGTNGVTGQVEIAGRCEQADLRHERLLNKAEP